MNKQGNNVMWIEQPNFVFDCVTRFLQFTVTTEDDPLALLVMSLLFYNLGKRELCDIALSRVEDILHDLPDIQDSGLQIRDCLLSSSYYYVARRVRRDTLPVDYIALARIKFAAENEWFGDSCLAAMVALISDEVRVGQEAKQYLRDRITFWLDNGYILGVLHYCLAGDEQLSDRLADYLARRDWSDDNVTTLTWSLLALGKLLQKGYDVRQLRCAVAQRLLTLLGSSDLVQTIVRGEMAVAHRSTGPLTSFDFAFAAYALNIEGFDSIIGVPPSQKEALDAMIKLQQLLAQGGRIMPKWQVVIGEVSFVTVIGSLTGLTLYLAGRQSFWEFLAGIIGSVLSAAFGIWFLRRRLPSEAALAIFGDVALQGDAGGETYGHENQSS